MNELVELEQARLAEQRRRQQIKAAYRAQRNPVWSPGSVSKFWQDRASSGVARGASAEDFAPPMDLLDASAMAPGVGDVTGPMADLRMFYNQPESRTPLNVGLAMAGILPAVPSVSGAKRLATEFKNPRTAFRAVEKPPQTIVSGYRAARIYPDDPRFPGIYPAMLGKGKLGDRQQIPIGEWQGAEFRPFGMKPRKGIHAGLLPRAQQFDLTRPDYKGMMPPDMVWTRASMGADLDLSNYLDPNKPTKIYQKSDVPFKDPSELPEGGFYLYSNQKSDPPWLVSDYSRIDEVLTDEEVNDILRSAGLPASPPRFGGPVTEARLRELGLL